ncbi:MAG TPA: outer membrane beta-barrel protein [Gemmatimonadales bacterium]|nr:outer membrane beta-barrel protein [Gemmatimonadales bacterium]
MKTLVRGVAVGLAVVLGAQTVHAQMGVSLGFGGGAAMPTGTMADGNTTGWSSEIVARLKPAGSPIGLQLDGFYNRFGLEGGIDGNSRLIGSTANAVFAFPGAGRAHPYLIGGVGVYNGQTSIDGLGSSDSQTKFGANAGAGLDVGLGKRATVFAQGRVHAIFQGVTDATPLEEETAYMVPLTVGLRGSLQ